MALSLTSTALWLKLTKEVSWAYRLKKTHAPTMGFVLGKGTGLLPSKPTWESLRKEVNKLRRNTRSRNAASVASEAAQKKREYMRLYMARKRRERARPIKGRKAVAKTARKAARPRWWRA